MSPRSIIPAARAVYKYSLGLAEDGQRKAHMVLSALREYYGASIGVSGERQKFLRLLQNENEPIASWETRVRNQAAQCEYENFADELTRDQFIAGLASEAVRVKLIGKGHRHRLIFEIPHKQRSHYETLLKLLKLLKRLHSRTS